MVPKTRKNKRIHIVDVGTGKGRWIIEHRKENPDENVLAVEPALDPKFSGHRIMSVDEAKRQATRLQDAGIRVRAEPFGKTLQFLRRGKYRVQLINFDMPSVGFDGKGMIQAYSIRPLLKHAPRLLLPKGRIRITSDSTEDLKKIRDLARTQGLKTTNIRIPQDLESRMTPAMRKRMKNPDLIKELVVLPQ